MNHSFRNYKVLESVLLVSEVRGHLSAINELVEQTNAKAVIHTGCFGFYSPTSYKFLHTGELRHIADHLYYGSRTERANLANHSSPDVLREYFSRHPLSELHDFVVGRQHFKVPVYAIWGNREDVQVVQQFRTGGMQVPNLHVLFPDVSYTIPCGSLTVRLFGLGGGIFYDRLFNLGAGDGHVSGDSGHCWVNFLQLGELFEMAQGLALNEREVRVLVSHYSMGREPLLNLAARQVQAAYCVSGGHFSRLTCTFNEFSAHTLTSFREWLSDALTPLEEMVQRVLDCADLSDRERTLTLLTMSSLRQQREAVREEADMKKGMCVALTHYEDGHAVLNGYEEGYLGVDTFSRGFRFFSRPKTTAASTSTTISSTSTVMPSTPIVVPSTPSAPLQIPSSVDSQITADLETASPGSSSSARLSEMASNNFAGSAIVIVSNLPYVQNEEDVRETLLAEYKLKSITFYNRFCESVRCEAADEQTAVKIVQDLDGTSWRGHALRVSRVGGGAKTSGAIFTNIK